MTIDVGLYVARRGYTKDWDLRGTLQMGTSKWTCSRHTGKLSRNLLKEVGGRRRGVFQWLNPSGTGGESGSEPRIHTGQSRWERFRTLNATLWSQNFILKVKGNNKNELGPEECQRLILGREMFPHRAQRGTRHWLESEWKDPSRIRIPWECRHKPMLQGTVHARNSARSAWEQQLCYETGQYLCLCLTAVRFGTSYLTLPNLNFLHCKMGIIIVPTSWGWW